MELQDKSSDIIEVSIVDTDVTRDRPEIEFSIATLLELETTSWGHVRVVSAKSSNAIVSLSGFNWSETCSCLGEETGVNRARSGVCSSCEEWTPSIEESAVGSLLVLKLRTGLDGVLDLPVR